MNTPEIPYGFKRVFGQLQKGDGVWDGQKFKKVRKELTPVTVMRMRWPIVHQAATVAIRRCTVEQTPLPLELQPREVFPDQPCQNPGCPHTIVDHSEEKCGTCGHGIKAETFEA